MNSVDNEWMLFLSKQDSILEFNSVNTNTDASPYPHPDESTHLDACMEKNTNIPPTDDRILLTATQENERIAGANKSQTVDKGWGRILLFGSAQPTQKYEAKGGFTGGYAPNGGNLGFPTDDRILLTATKDNEDARVNPHITGFSEMKSKKMNINPSIDVSKKSDIDNNSKIGKPRGDILTQPVFSITPLKIKEDAKVGAVATATTTKPVPVTECVKPFELIISTKTKVLFLNKSIDIFSIFWKIPIVDYWKPEKGVIKKQIKIVSKTKKELEEYQAKLVDLNYYQENIIKQIDNPTSRSIKFKDERKLTVGMSKKDITVQRSRVKNAFYNCMALILRFKYDDIFKEIHVKVFNTGKMEIPGIVNYAMLQYVKEMILDILKTYGEEIPSTNPTPPPTLSHSSSNSDVSPLPSDSDISPVVDTSPLCFVDNFKEEHVLINSNFNCGYFIHRERLYNILISPKYGLEASFDPCNYSGVKCRYYFNNEYGLDRESQKGVIMDDDKRMKLSDLMECKKYTEVSLMIFRTGSCIIVGNCSEKILRFIFEFIKEILIVEYKEICFNDEIPQVKNKSFKMIKRNINVSSSS